MGRVLAVATALSCALMMAPAVTGAGVIVEEIAVDDPPGADAFAFTPDRVDVLVNGPVHWSRGVDGDARHSITQTDGFFRLAPTNGLIDFTRRFSAGTFRYFCEIHGSPARGMDGVVRVMPDADTDPLGPNFDVRWAEDETLETGDRFDVRYRRQGASDWKRWERNTPLTKAEFGLGNEPERAVQGRAYEFTARSKGNASGAKSGWSPPLVVVAE